MWSKLKSTDLYMLCDFKPTHLSLSEKIVYSVLQQKYITPDMGNLDDCAKLLFKSSLINLLRELEGELDLPINTDICKPCDRTCQIKTC